MATNAESLAQEIAAMKDMLSKVSAAIDIYAETALKNVGQTNPIAQGETSEAHTALVTETSKLLRTVRGPVDMVFSNFENSAHSGALRTVMEMGVFDALPLDQSPLTATALSEQLNVEKILLVRFMRVLTTVAGPFAEVGFEEYSHTPYSLVYMAPPLRGIFKLMYDEYNLANAKMYEYFRENGFKIPVSHLNNPYCHAHQTGELDMWETIGKSPARLESLNLAMVAQTGATAWTVGIFPFKEELSKFETTDETVLVVDIGGGKGHVTKQIKEFTAGIPGKIVLQERPEALNDLVDSLHGVTLSEYDFFTPQPIKGALIYYIRRCLHDWSDEDCVKILTQISLAMKPGVSRLLISEIVLPETNADIEAGWMDMTMITMNGMERTESQWVKLLDLSGLKLHKTYHAPGTNYGAVEAYLK